MTNEEHKIEFQLLKDNLINNYVIYHERVTLLLQLTVFDIEDTRVNFKAKIIKPLNKARAEENRLYHNMISKNEISFSASYLFGKDDTSLLINNKKLGRAYCPFTLWLDPELSKFVLENEDDVTKKIPKYILWSEDWRVLKTKD
jgi:hypothetical protein